MAKSSASGAMLSGRAALINNGNVKEARTQQLESEVAMLREELRINGTRMQRIPPHRRPQYSAVERMAEKSRRVGIRQCQRLPCRDRPNP
jgi:hypothetical protein